MKRLKAVFGIFMAVMICSAFTMNDDALAAKKYVKSIKVKSKATITIPVNKKTVTKTYKVTVKVKSKASKKFTARSSKKSVASVKVSGKKIKVTARKSGIAKITVKTKAKGKKGKKLSKKLVITVKKETKPEPDKEGAITKKAIKMYGYDGANRKIAGEDTVAYFSSKYPDVPFVTDDMAIENFLTNLRYTTKAKAVVACGYAMEAICGQCNINTQNPVTLALHQCVIDYDLNFDGKYDENDKSLPDLGKNVAVLISDYSFSSANLLPNALDQLDDRILLIGQKSGGGACAVGYISTAVGSTMQISSENRLSTMKNGYIRDIDDGIAPDVYIPLNRMYDREYINQTVSDKFGN